MTKKEINKLLKWAENEISEYASFMYELHEMLKNIDKKVVKKRK